MNIREAILRAADRIQAEPRHYDFDNNKVPDLDNCGTPGCMIGWIGVFAGFKNGEPVSVVSEALGTSDLEFYHRIRQLSRDGFCALLAAEDVPAALRAYADKYHPAESRALIPASVRAIFTMTPAELTRELERA